MRLRIPLIAIVASALMAACAPRVEYVDTFCTSYTPVSYSAANDTADTKRQVKENNAVWKKLCK